VTLAEQLEAARRREQIQKWDAGDAKVAAELPIKPPRPVLSADVVERFNRFSAFAASRSARKLPARPATVAAFVVHENSLGVPAEQIISVLNAVQEVHDYHSLASPVACRLTRAALELVVKSEPPRSWSKSEKADWALLPPDIRSTISRRMREVELALRRAQNEAAEAKKTTATNEADIKHVQIEKELRNDSQTQR
jgi:hypothetical protein